LEWDGTHLWANRWKTDEIVRIDPVCRRVDGVVDASSLEALARSTASASEGGAIDVLNGIAKVPDTDQFLVTGKLWPSIYRVRFVRA
jgi:glutaminyl-peptide cyclotransferase